MKFRDEDDSDFIDDPDGSDPDLICIMCGQYLPDSRLIAGSIDGDGVDFDTHSLLELRLTFCGDCWSMIKANTRPGAVSKAKARYEERIHQDHQDTK